MVAPLPEPIREAAIREADKAHKAAQQERGLVMLPIIKEDGYLWFVDFRLKEKRRVDTAERDRFDSGGLHEEYYRSKIAEGKLITIAADCDADDKEEMGMV